VGGVIGGKLFRLVGRRPWKLSNIWNPGKNALRLYGRDLVGAGVAFGVHSCFVDCFRNLVSRFLARLSFASRLAVPPRRRDHREWLQTVKFQRTLTSHDDVERVARPARYDELVAAGAAAASWFAILALYGPRLAFQTVWILLLIALPLGAWTILIRLRYSPSRVRLTVGPWSRAVNLNELKSIHWRYTGGWRSRGTVFVRDRSGHHVPIYVGRFKGGEEWGPLLLHAAAASGATVDTRSREILEHHERETIGL